LVDRVYKADIPKMRSALQRLKEDFSNLDSKTNWTKLRIEPLLDHLRSLEGLLESDEFSREFSHLTKGVEMFHSDLVYFKKNINGLEKILRSEKKSSRRNEV
jgi:predicted RNase H-like nuclease (RuvC/YqgF family)